MAAPTPPPRRREIGFGVTLIVTNLTKIAGLAVVLNEVFVHGTVRAVVLATSAFMMAGAQLSERVVLSALDRLLGHPVEPPAQDGAGRG